MIKWQINCPSVGCWFDLGTVVKMWVGEVMKHRSPMSTSTAELLPGCCNSRQPTAVGWCAFTHCVFIVLCVSLSHGWDKCWDRIKRLKKDQKSLHLHFFPDLIFNCEKKDFCTGILVFQTRYASLFVLFLLHPKSSKWSNIKMPATETEGVGKRWIKHW